MTVVNCDIRDSLGQPLVGYIRVTLDWWLADGGQSYTTVPAQVPLVAGVASLTLEPSEIARVTYVFDIYRTGSPDTLVQSFRATVPDSLTPISLNELAPTGVTRDAQSSAIGAITRRIYADADFWDAVRVNVFPQKGAYSPTAWYRAGDVVFWNGGSYVNLSVLSTQGVPPSNTTVWQQWAAQGTVGSGTSGNNNPYDATGWDGQLDAPSRNAVRDIIETLATKTEVNARVLANGATLTNASIGDTVPLSDNSARVAYTSWVQSLVAQVDQASVPIGTIAQYAGSSAPSRWILCDGRAISRTTFSALFGILGTAYGAGNGSTTFNIPDLRGRVAVGTDSTALQGAANRIPGATLASGGGARETTLAANNLPAHSHPSAGTGFFVQQAAGTIAITNTGGTIHGVQSNTGNNTTSSTPVGLLQPYLTVNHIIYAGV